MVFFFFFGCVVVAAVDDDVVVDDDDVVDDDVVVDDDDLKCQSLSNQGTGEAYGTNGHNGRRNGHDRFRGR